MLRIVAGDDEFEVNKHLDHIKSEFKTSSNELALKQIYLDDENYQSIQTEITSTNLFSPKGLYLLKIKELTTQLEQFTLRIIEDNSFNNEVVLVLGSDTKQSFLKSISSFKEILIFKTDKNFNIIKWIMEYASEKGGQINLQTAKYLKDNVSNNKLYLSSEIDKLILFDSSITIENINEICFLSFNSNVFNLVYDVFNQRPVNAIKTYRGLRELNEPAPKIMATFTWAIYLIGLIKLSDESISDISKNNSVNINSLKNFSNFTNKISFDSYKKIVSELVNIDLKSKTTNLDVDQAMEAYFLEINQLVN